jgi:O-acetyl-ADP-ribose deacetylase (regulator of RNase III)
VDEILRQLRAGAEARPWDHSDDPAAAPFLARYAERRRLYLEGETLPQADVYTFGNGRRLVVLTGDITEQEVDALVSSDDESLSMGGGVSRRILNAGGPSIAEEAYRYVVGRSLYPLAERPAKYVLPSHGVRPGRAVVTAAGELKAKFIFHGVTLGADAGTWVEPSRDLIAEIMESCFYHADTLRIRSIAFPLLATGAGGFPKDVCLDTMFRFLVRKLLRGVTTVTEARLVLYFGSST